MTDDEHCIDLSDVLQDFNEEFFQSGALTEFNSIVIGNHSLSFNPVGSYPGTPDEISEVSHLGTQSKHVRASEERKSS